MKIVFWFSAFVVAYAYIGYPLLLAAWTRLRARSREGAAASPTWPGLPPISVILAARNEGPRLPARIENLLAQDYPAGLLDIVVVSDGSTDDTETVLAGLAPRVRALLLPAVGKAAALNAGVAAARHDLLVFADARQRFARDAIRRLVAPFADDRVGGVSGELVLDAEQEDDAGGIREGVGLYWRYEKWIRLRESLVGSVVGATGAIYALRRVAWRPLPPDTLLDDVLAPMRAVLMGYRILFEPLARAFDTASDSATVEQRRKTRTLAGNYQLLRLEPRLLIPGLNPVWLQFVSHKLVRLVVPYALVALLVSNTALANAGPIYSLALILQVTFYVLALHGAAIETDRGEPAGIPAGESRLVASRRRPPAHVRAGKELVNASGD